MTKMEGMQELLKKLNAMGKIDRNEVRGIVKEEGQQIILTAKSLAAKKSGGLQQSIGFITKKDSTFPTTVLIGPDYTKGGQHAHIIEFGTKERFRGDKVFFKLLKSARRSGVSESTIQRSLESHKGLHSTGIGPKLEFMRPAFDRHKMQVQKGVLEKVEKLIFQQAKKNKLI